MSEISDLESRISAAMDRISRGLESYSAPVASEEDTGKAEALQAELDSEKTANAQLEERNKSLNERVEALESELSEARDAIEKAAEAREAAEKDLASARDAADKADASRSEAEEALAAARAAVQEAADQAEEAARQKEEQSHIDLDANRDAIKDLSQRLRRMRRTSRLVRGTNQMLREAAEKGLSDPALVNQALSAELESLKALRAAEQAEMDVIVGALRPMLDVSDEDAATEEGEA